MTVFPRLISEKDRRGRERKSLPSLCDAQQEAGSGSLESLLVFLSNPRDSPVASTHGHRQLLEFQFGSKTTAEKNIVFLSKGGINL